MAPVQQQDDKTTAKSTLLDLIHDRVTDAGSIRQMSGPAYMDAVNPDAASKAAFALVPNGKADDLESNGKADDLKSVAKYLKWYDEHQKKEGATASIGGKKVSLAGTIPNFEKLPPQYDKYVEEQATTPWAQTASSHLLLVQRYEEAVKSLPADKKTALDAIADPKKIHSSAVLSYQAIANLTDKDGLVVESPGYQLKSYTTNVEVYAGRQAAAAILTDADKIKVGEKDIDAQKDAATSAGKLPESLATFKRSVDAKHPDDKRFAPYKQGDALLPYVDPKADLSEMKDDKGKPLSKNAVDSLKNVRHAQVISELTAAAYSEKNPKILDQMVAEGVLKKSDDGKHYELVHPEDGVGHFSNQQYVFAKYPSSLIAAAARNSVPEQYADLQAKAEKQIKAYPEPEQAAALMDMTHDMQLFIGGPIRPVPVPAKKVDGEKVGMNDPMHDALMKFNDPGHVVATTTGTSIPNLVAAANKGKGGIA